MSDVESLRDQTKKTIRSLLLSSKDGLSLHELERDHAAIMGFSLPFKKLGYSSSSDMLNRMQDVCRKTMGRTGEVYKAVADENTVHIAQLVANQKSKPKKKSIKFKANFRKPNASYSFKATHQYVPPRKVTPRKDIFSPKSSDAVMDLRQKILQQPFSGNTSNYSQPERKPPPAAERTVKVIFNGSAHVGDDKIKQNLRSLLAAYSSGLWLHNLQEYYKDRYNSIIPVEYWDKLASWTDILSVETINDRKILYPVPEIFKQIPEKITVSFQQEVKEMKFTAQQNIQHRQVTVEPDKKFTVHPTIQHRQVTVHQNYEDKADFTTIIRPFSPLLIGQPTDVFICHVDEYSEHFYLHLKGSPIQEMTTNLEQHFKSAKPKSYKEIPPNTYCCVKDSVYNSWNRAVVLKAVHQNKTEVLYVDFGNKEEKMCEELQPLPNKFMDPEAQAIRCILYNVAPLNLQLYTEELKHYIQECEMVAICKYLVSSDGVCEIIIYDKNFPGISLNEQLVNKGAARWVQPNVLIPPLVKTESTDASMPATGDTAEKDDSSWTVVVTYIESPAVVYLRRLTESHNHYEKFRDEAQNCYLNEKPVSLLVINEDYIAHVDDGDGEDWCRVKALELIDKNLVSCEYLDYGYKGIIDRKNLLPISTQHKKIPKQTQRCRLYGLEDLEAVDDNNQLLDALIDMLDDKTLIAQIITVEEGIPHVVLFDTSGDDDVEINKEMGCLLDDNKLIVQLPACNHTCDVLITFIDGDGTFYVQKVGPNYLILKELMTDINVLFSKQKMTSEDIVMNANVGDVVCAKYEGIWYRAKITETSKENKMVTVYFGDYGNYLTVKFSHIRKIPENIKHVKSLPMQALACKLSGLNSWNDDVAVEAASFVDTSDPYMLRTVSEAAPDSPALVILMQGELSVNNYLLKAYMDSSDGVAGTLSSLELSSSNRGSLSETVQGKPASKIPEVKADNIEFSLATGDNKIHIVTSSVHSTIPEFCKPPGVGEFWDVFVTTVTDPGNFIVVPLEDIKQLNELVDNLHQEYKNSKPVGFDCKPGDICAGLSSTDGFWYRVVLQDGKVDNKFKVLFVDYGNYDYIATDNLRPLKPEFLKLKLQGVKASLSDIGPADRDAWTDEAIQSFESLCLEKCLVASVMWKDESKTLLDFSPSVRLVLHDTSGDKFINIQEELVKSEHAIYKKQG